MSLSTVTFAESAAKKEHVVIGLISTHLVTSQDSELDSKCDESPKNLTKREPSGIENAAPINPAFTFSYFADYLHENRIYFIASSFYCIYHCFEASSIFRLNNKG
jgi:hypothetical protein